MIGDDSKADHVAEEERREKEAKRVNGARHGRGMAQAYSHTYSCMAGGQAFASRLLVTHLVKERVTIDHDSWAIGRERRVESGIDECYQKHG